jgi:hypothetical protein
LWREDLRAWSGAAEGTHDTNPEVLDPALEGVGDPE